MGRCWTMMMVASMGAVPAFCGPCCLQTHDNRQAFLETALSQPWAADPGSTDLPNGWVAQVINNQLNPDPNDNLPLQSVLNTLYYSIQTVIESQIDVQNPYGWADLGRPR